MKINPHLLLPALTATAVGAAAQVAVIAPPDSVRYIDPLREYIVVGLDTIHLSFLNRPAEVPSGSLTEKDFEEVAAELGVEVAAVKAVVDIEAGKEHKGFWDEGKPLINFDLSVYRRMAARRKINLDKYTTSHPLIFARPDTKRFGSRQAAVQARLDQALSIDSVSAIEGTFWGMFQIGGFNWRQCGTDSPAHFVELMSRSERDQLELFAAFITRTGLLPALREKNWSAFARGYNGPSYAARGYHTRLAAAYARHKAEENARAKNDE